jgi:hypothetical protein
VFGFILKQFLIAEMTLLPLNNLFTDSVGLRSNNELSRVILSFRIAQYCLHLENIILTLMNRDLVRLVRGFFVFSFGRRVLRHSLHTQFHLLPFQKKKKKIQSYSTIFNDRRRL